MILCCGLMLPVTINSSLANARRCARTWPADLRTLAIFLGQSADCRGIRNNYEIRGEANRHAYNGAKFHELYAQYGELGFDEDELIGPFTFDQIDAMRQTCPDYRRPHCLPPVPLPPVVTPLARITLLPSNDGNE